MTGACGFETLADGFVSLRQAGTDTAAAMGPRCAVTRTGDVLCAFMVQSATGVNDFKPMQARSRDGGRTWTEEGPLWPRLQEEWSIFGSVSRAPDGTLLFFGSRTPIDEPGGPNWCDATQGLKQNELFWALSVDEGTTWGEPAAVPMAIAGAAEVTGPLCVTRDGTWHACYSPYNTFDPALVVDRSQLVHLYSSDRGRTWRSNTLMRFAHSYATAAEAWLVELSDGRLLSTCWNLNQQDGSDFPNAFALSEDSGRTWLLVRSTGIRGQSTALCPLPEGRALFMYNQRKHGPTGVWMAVVQPTPDDFGVLCNERVRAAPEDGSPRPGTAWTSSPRETHAPGGQAGRGFSQGRRGIRLWRPTGHTQWMYYAFGEPAAAVLPDATILLVFWCTLPDARGIRYAKLLQTGPAKERRS